MNKLAYLLLVFLLSNRPEVATSQVKQKQLITSGSKDSVMIDAEENYKVAKKDLPALLKECPEFKEEGLSPDDSYALQRKNTDFDCEVCQDDYYRLYAYFLKQRNGVKKYRVERLKLIQLYRDINLIHGRLRGGNGFGHQDRRILGYAEYSIYQLKEDSDDYIKTYSISKQKALYITSLRQLITDELDTDNDISAIDKPLIKKQMFETVNDINGLLTNYFYLESARTYQY